jgi:hypothetical protein
MLDDSRLHEALARLGALLTERGQPFEVLAVGGGALLLLGLSARTTADLDVIARRTGHRWRRAQPLPPALVQAVDDVATVLELESDKPWLNDRPSFLFDMGLPKGWSSRTTTKRFGVLVVHLLGREDLIKLKLWAATNSLAPERRDRDVGDLRRLAPTPEELSAGLRWCAGMDGTADFLTSATVAEVVCRVGDGASGDLSDV